jgi:hypothetical protein
VSEARAQGFAGLPGYEDLDAVRVSPGLPAPFAHRVPLRGRRRAVPGPQPANDLFDPTPITLLVPSGAGTNERLEVFAPPLPASLGKFWGAFVARGVGRLPGSESAVEKLTPHEPLFVRAEPENPYNPRALLLLRADGAPIGHVPDYLANELADASAAFSSSSTAPDSAGAHHAVPDDFSVEVLSAELVNHAPSSPIYSVLCRYRCGAELGAQLFRSERYQPVASRAYRV